MNKKLRSLYGLKFNPFSPEIPTEALWVTPALENFCWRIEQQIGEGGFALVLGHPGSGKSVGLRHLSGRLGALRDVMVGILSRPQANLADFYRELGELFGVGLTPHNRWCSAKLLREKWRQHIETSLCRPVLLVDEAQEACAAVLCELRLLTSSELDSRSILTVVLAGDGRLAEKLDSAELSPLASRIRTRLRTEELSPQQLLACLAHVLEAAGNPRLMSPAVRQTLCEHAAGNPRLLMNMGHELLATACHKQLDTLDEKLYFDVFAQEPRKAGKPRAAA
jgi:type II secretory pathway predicted ATPase ExeA